jgi:hypothetical protein
MDSTIGLIRFGERDYSPTTRRWTAKDKAGVISAINLYGYARNDPINSVDRNGRVWKEVTKELLIGSNRILMEIALRIKA